MRSIYGLLDLNVLRWSINRLLMQRTEESQGKHCEDNTPLRAGFQPCGARSAAAPGRRQPAGGQGAARPAGAPVRRRGSQRRAPGAVRSGNEVSGISSITDADCGAARGRAARLHSLSLRAARGAQWSPWIRRATAAGRHRASFPAGRPAHRPARAKAPGTDTGRFHSICSPRRPPYAQPAAVAADRAAAAPPPRPAAPARRRWRRFLWERAPRAHPPGFPPV